MRGIARSLVRFLKREDGVSTVECALLLAMIVVICIVSINQFNPAVVGEPVVVAASQK
jgi:Flp pilus assembly pilin Flp